MKITVNQLKLNLVKIQDEFRAKYPDCSGAKFIFEDIKTGRQAALWNDFFGFGFDILWEPTLKSAKSKSQIIVVSYDNPNEEIEVNENTYTFKGRKMKLKIALTFNIN